MMKLQPVTLEGPRVHLEPLQHAHAAGLAAAIRDGELWQITQTIVPHPDDLPAFFDQASAVQASGKELAFAIIDKATGEIAGSTRFRCYEPAHKRIEIGFSFLGRRWQRTYVNSEAKYLLLQHAFDVLGCNRVELLTDVLNTPSRNAIARLGAREEGVMRQHMVMRDGRVRDTVAYSIVKGEWAEVRARLEGRGLTVSAEPEVSD
ncbi:putative ribosomal N-acetyltransferase YdaF [Andreprevotia sp. IGB-42]|uniref:GNAT family N-acetyltransferase n=1 Tax=Andreprevotia sp. IGB-42 TaxID=2497473 RepID=UPI00157F0942|nr:GNAT family protein [Andreprevotia sp. IGB-42]KAF0811462.1 putative ribosomal N-acetyltransferase YdaF [Andreprevotia sp. IGB-42]